MLDVRPYLSELSIRVNTIRRIIDAAHPPVPGPNDISREARGLAILLLFASYEHLLTSLCRGLLETAKGLRVGNRRLKPGIRLFALSDSFKSIRDSSKHNIWTEAGPKLVSIAADSSRCTIDTNRFPDDGSFMKTSQVKVVCSLFELGDPAPVLREVWTKLDAIVADRNGIAHGRLTPEEVGRRYTHAELSLLINQWEQRWTEFINHVGTKASTRDFFRTSR